MCPDWRDIFKLDFMGAIEVKRISGADSICNSESIRTGEIITGKGDWTPPVDLCGNS